jgi:hypothetical protein
MEYISTYSMDIVLFGIATDLVEVQILRCPMDRRLGGFQSRSGGLWKKQSLSKYPLFCPSSLCFDGMSSIKTKTLLCQYYNNVSITTMSALSIINNNRHNNDDNIVQYKTDPGSDNVGKTADVFTQIFCPDCAVHSEVNQHEHAVCSLLLS